MSGKTSAKSINKYKAKAYDRIGLEVPKGDRERIRDHADRLGVSVNAFIRRAIDEAMERDYATMPPPARPDEADDNLRGGLVATASER